MLRQIARVYSYVSFYKSCKIQLDAHLSSMCLSEGRAHAKFVTSRMNYDNRMWAPNAKDHLVWVDMESGLTDASRNSKLTIEEADQQILNFLKMYIPPGKCPVAGSSVYMDRLFMNRYLPEVDKYLHYRIVDVSTIKELCRRWSPTVFAKTPPKIWRHRSLSDIKESIKELQYYKSSFFKI